jgi:hypothetical protein
VQGEEKLLIPPGEGLVPGDVYFADLPDDISLTVDSQSSSPAFSQDARSWRSTSSAVRGSRRGAASMHGRWRPRRPARQYHAPRESPAPKQRTKNKKSSCKRTRKRNNKKADMFLVANVSASIC